MDESEACSLPGGLASVKKQFESQEFASSSSQSSVAQFHYEQRSVQVRMDNIITHATHSLLESVRIFFLLLFEARIYKTTLTREAIDDKDSRNDKKDNK